MDQIQHSKIKEEMQEFVSWQIDFRRWLHEHPELMFEEIQTSQHIQKELTKMGIEFTTGWGKGYVNGKQSQGTGIVAYIGTKKPPCVGLRADMDALPVSEKTNLDFVSKHPGKMHACGHDAHMAILMGVAKYLKKHEKEIDGTFCLIFQPAEEGGAGAKFMIEEGCLTQNPPVQAILGLHTATHYKVGEVYCRPGAILAASSCFKVEVLGEGGHGSMPVISKDPIATAAMIIQGAYTYVARKTSSTEAKEVGVISFTAIESPQSYNVIPSWAKMKGTLRSLCDKKMIALQTDLEKIVVKTSEMYDQKGVFEICQQSYPVTYNHEELYKWSVEQIKATQIKELKYIEQPVMGSEDFSFYAQKVPGCYYMLGVTPPEATSFPGMHSDVFCIDEKCLLEGSAFLCYMAQRLLIQTKISPFHK